jgi:hydroxyacylglutathione hydrolase
MPLKAPPHAAAAVLRLLAARAPITARSSKPAFRCAHRAFHLAANDHLVPPAMRITPIPLFSDNYAWRIDDAAHGTSVLVDPADAAACLATYGGGGSSDAPELVAALCTHHHADHSGGNVELAAARAGIAVIGGAGEGGRIPAATRLVNDGDTVEVGGMRFTVLSTPCHTRGHVCYFTDADPDAPPAVFTGDTLFAGGCGRFFEGDAPTMAASLAKLAALPRATRVYAGHEYTVANLQFCAHVEPGNAATAARLQRAVEARRGGAPTLPSTIGEELATNVFLRCGEPAVADFTHPGWRGEQGSGSGTGRQPDAVEVLARLREAKNAFSAPKLV